jgi:hypothetical protein
MRTRGPVEDFGPFLVDSDLEGRSIVKPCSRIIASVQPRRLAASSSQKNTGAIRKLEPAVKKVDRSAAAVEVALKPLMAS